jgi:membrane-bound lytic murein transglycosylase MltF
MCKKQIFYNFILYCLTISLGFTSILLPRTTLGGENPLSVLGSHFKKQYQDDLDVLLKKRYIRVLTTFNKTNYFLCGVEQFGFEYSLLKDYEKSLNKTIKRSELKVVLEFIPVSRDKLLPMLIGGLGDIAAAGLTITPERLQKADFTNQYLTGIDEVIVVHHMVKDLKSLDDLSGRRVFVRSSSSYYESLISLNQRLVEESKAPVQIIEADENLETEDILEMVNAGAIDITVSDSHLAQLWSSTFTNIKILNHLKIRQGGKIAWMVRKNNPLLKASLNRFIRTHRKGTLLGNIYFNRYYKNNKWIKNPLSSKEQKKLDRYLDLIKKYSQQYGFDWRLILALAYQESGLDHSKKNPSGAVGLMQVLPSTAADKNINIGNVDVVEKNIHAGVKYLDFLKNRYFNNPDVHENDRVRFALASYNAGPRKIRRVRKLAENMGLDQNIWFRNAEMAALKIIGQETVGYVSSINKYYIVYKLGLAN